MNKENEELFEQRLAFEAHWHYKVVVPRLGGALDGLPIKHYVVTAAIYEYDERGTVLALCALDYTPENKHWFTMHIKKEVLEETMFGLELIDTPEAEALAQILQEKHHREIDKKLDQGETPQDE